MKLFTKPRLALAAVAAVLAAGAAAYAGGSGPSTPQFTPTQADQVTNIDVLRQQIKNYYGVPNATTGPTGSWAAPLDQNSPYAQEASGVAREGTQWLAARAKTPKAAVVLDVDDTTLATWDYELYSNWDYNPSTNATFVLGEAFPAVPGMVAMVDAAKADGYAIFWITGRPPAQEAATLGNLEHVGYPAPTDVTTGVDGLFTKPAVADYPPYLQAACAGEPGGKCTTIEYKSATRAYIESQGWEIVADVGDQYSDLIGGSADKTFKLPNPNYYLP